MVARDGNVVVGEEGKLHAGESVTVVDLCLQR